MFNSNYTTLDFYEFDSNTFDTIENALMTKCPYCGTELEWNLKVKYNAVQDKPEIFGESFSCGVTFVLQPSGIKGMYAITQERRRDNNSI